MRGKAVTGKKLKIGIIGSGGMARHHVDGFGKIDSVEVVAIASRNAQTGAQLAETCSAKFLSDWNDLVQHEGLDGVVICTHNNSHGEIAVAALRSDKHVFTEYPLARSIDEGEEAVRLAKSNRRVLRVSHSETVSNSHKAIKRKVGELGQLLLTSFLRLTAGRGGRPEILFNLPISGPPAHFFVYHIYPIIDLFGGVEWVEAGAVYEGLTDNGGYHRFVNAVTVGFKAGGIGQWTWSGGIEINAAEQHQRYVLTDGALINSGSGWTCSTRSGIEDVLPFDGPSLSLQELWLDEIQEGGSNAAHADAAIALEAIKVSLYAEQSMQENRRIALVN